MVTTKKNYLWQNYKTWKKENGYLKNKKSEEFKKLEELIEGQKFINEDSFDSINRNKDLIKLHILRTRSMQQFQMM